jgi:transcriptional regulator with XRE-family HTH domain
MGHPIDIEIGNRVRVLRLANGLTQSDLASSTGITFQQIQKYETGVNRISCSRLWLIAAALKVPVADFFDGMDGLDSLDQSEHGLGLADLLENRELLELQHAYNKLDETRRSAILKLVIEIAGDDARN